MKNICIYKNDILSLIRDYAPEKLEGLTKDQIDTIDSLCDWEDFLFVVTDNETVISADSINGDVFAENTLAEFIDQALEEAMKEDDSAWDNDVNPFLPDYMDNDDRDYSPSDPWNAPGMKVSDFITGVSPF